MTRSLTLVVGNKNYSSWSLRPWSLTTQLGIPFTERMLKFDSEDWDENIAGLSPTRLVPVLWEGDPGQGFATFDTSAIAERLADLYPDRGIWPADERARARARSLVATFHSGYAALRTALGAPAPPPAAAAGGRKNAPAARPASDSAASSMQGSAAGTGCAGLVAGIRRGD